MNTTIPIVCGSVAANPSPLGVKLHNAGYEALAIDYRYVAIGSNDISSVVQCVRTLPMRGLGVSMPFKKEIIEFLDEPSTDVLAIGACNTVVNEGGHLTGHNTDWVGAIAALEEAGVVKFTSATIVGAGGVARAIAYGLKQRGAAVFIAARSSQARRRLLEELHLDGESDIDEQGRFRSEILVNATPIAEAADGPVALQAHPKARFILDVVFNLKETPLVQVARSRGLQAAPGWRMLLHQALGQFRLYTGENPPIDQMSTVLEAALP